MEELRERGYIRVGTPGVSTPSCWKCVLTGYDFDRSTDEDELYRGDIFIRRDPSIVMPASKTELVLSSNEKEDLEYGESCAKSEDCLSGICSAGSGPESLVSVIRTCGCRRDEDCFSSMGFTSESWRCDISKSRCVKSGTRQSVEVSKDFQVEWYSGHFPVGDFELFE